MPSARSQNAAAHRELRAFRKKLEDGVSRAYEHASEVAGEKLVELTQAGFELQRDPHGKKWRRKKKPDGRKILHGKTGDLKRLWEAEASRRAIKLESPVKYFGVHQKGNATHPRRAMVPYKGLPKKYEKALEEIFFGELERLFK